MTEKHNWVTDDLCLIEETTGVKLYGTVCTDISFIAKQLNMANKTIRELEKENKELKHHIKKLEKELHLAHMRTMFSTVKSFKGDVSKRYYYSEETDTLYDSANHYGQYHKILDKKEIAMLLNEYETLLNNGE